MQGDNPKISVIVPTFNEADHIGALLATLKMNCSNWNLVEVIVVDGGSTDDTFLISKNHGVVVFKSPKGRAIQMNYGARKANGKHLYFLHADTLPPKRFDQKICSALNQNQQAGCFRMKFDSTNLMLRFFSFFTRFNFLICRGGDQSLFVSKSQFEEIGGFDENYKVYEDVEIIARLQKKTNFKIIADYVITSARRYQQKGLLKLQYHFGIIHLKNFLGKGPEQLLAYYKKNVAT